MVEVRVLRTKHESGYRNRLVEGINGGKRTVISNHCDHLTFEQGEASIWCDTTMEGTWRFWSPDGRRIGVEYMGLSSVDLKAVKP